MLRSGVEVDGTGPPDQIFSLTRGLGQFIKMRSDRVARDSLNKCSEMDSLLIRK
jgi:hypothetical protein